MCVGGGGGGGGGAGYHPFELFLMQIYFYSIKKNPAHASLSDLVCICTVDIFFIFFNFYLKIHKSVPF